MLPFTLTLALLAGCGGGTGSAAGNSAAQPEQSAQEQGSGIPTYTPAEIRENNSARNLLTHHSALTYTRTFADGEDNVNSTICEQYTMIDGFLQTNAAYADETGTVVYSQQGYADGTYAGATYALSSDGGMYMTLYPNNETYESACDIWLAAADDDSMTETVTDTSEQDGAVIVTARTDYPDEEDLYEITLYYVDPETDDLLYMEATSYDAQDDSVVAVVKTQISYDDPVAFTDKPFETIITDSDYCEVNLIVDPQQDDMTVCWYPVAHGTQLSFMPVLNYTLYSDEELTQEIDTSVGIDVPGEVFNIFAVPQQG